MFRYLAAILCLLMPLGNGSLAWGDTTPAAIASPAATPTNPHSNMPACPVDPIKLKEECNPPPPVPSCQTCHGSTAQAE